MSTSALRLGIKRTDQPKRREEGTSYVNQRGVHVGGPISILSLSNRCEIRFVGKVSVIRGGRHAEHHQQSHKKLATFRVGCPNLKENDCSENKFNGTGSALTVNADLQNSGGGDAN
jgi:hypothetical protein